MPIITSLAKATAADPSAEPLLISLESKAPDLAAAASQLRWQPTIEWLLRCPTKVDRCVHFMLSMTPFGLRKIWVSRTILLSNNWEACEP